MKKKNKAPMIILTVVILLSVVGLFAIADGQQMVSQGNSGVSAISSDDEVNSKAESSEDASSEDTSSGEVSSKPEEGETEEVPNDGTYLIYLGNDFFNVSQTETDEKGNPPLHSTPEEWALSDVSAVVRDTQEILTEYIQVTDLGGFDAVTPGEYTMRFAIVKDEIKLVTFTKIITVGTPIMPRISGTLPMNMPPGAVVPSDAVNGTIAAGTTTRPYDYLMFSLEASGQMRFYARDSLPSLVGSSTDPLLKWYREYYGAVNTNILYNNQNHYVTGMTFESFTYDYTNPADPTNSPLVATTVYKNSDIRLYLTYEIEAYSRTFKRTYRVENISATNPVTIQDIRFYVDTAFHGADSGRGGYDNVNDVFYLWNNSTSGMLTQTTDPTTPFTSGQISQYGNASTRFQTATSPMPTDGGTGILKYCNTSGSYDTGWAFSWTTNQVLQPGEDITRNNYETVIPPGGLSVVSPSPKTAPQGAMVDYQFTIYNLSDSAQTATINGSTPSGWNIFLDQSSVVIPAGGSVVVTANVLVPTAATDGTVERFDLTASYTDSGGATKSGTGSVNTTVDSNMKAITNVQMTYKSDTKLSIRVHFNDKVPPNTATTVKLMYADGANAGQMIPTTLFPTVTQSINSGDEIADMVTTAVPNGKYYIYVTAQDVPYPHRTTVYLKDGTIEIPITDFSVTPPSAVIGRGNTATPFTTSYLPATATHTALTWNSLNHAIATVTATGAVTGVTVGTVTLEVWPTNYPLLKKTVTVEVKEVVTAISATPKTIEMRNGDTQTVTAAVTPATAHDKSLTWGSSATSVATVASSGADTAIVTGGATDGVSTITVTSVDQPTKKDTVTVNVDNTAPTKSAWSLSPGGTNPTNKNQTFTATVTDPVTNGFASGMTGGQAGVYTQMVAQDAIAPTFDPSATAGWTSMTASGSSYSYTYTAIAHGKYDIYLAMSDKLGNYSVIKYTDTLDVDKTPPVFDASTLTPLNVFQGTTGYAITTAGLQGVTASDDHDGALPASSITVSNTGSFNVGTPGKYTITLTAVDQAGNSTDATREVYVHGIPTFSLGASASINAGEESILLGGDSRLGYTPPGAVANYKTDYTLQNTTPTVSYSFVGADQGMTIDPATGKLDFSTLAETATTITVTVKYTAEYTNEILGISKTEKQITINITSNAATPNAPVVTPPTNGIVSPGNIIEFYQEHGAAKYSSGVLSTPGQWLNPVVKADVESAVSASAAAGSGDTSIALVSVKILVNGSYEVLTQSNLDTALGAIGEYKIRYEHKGNVSGATKFTFVKLQVNGEMVFTSTPINAQTSTGTLNLNDPLYGSAPTASYQKYDGSTPTTLTVVAPVAPSLGTVGTSEIMYTVNYPNNTAIPSKRVLRVHGTPTITATDAFIRVGESTPAATGSVQLAPVAVGGSPTTATVTPTASTINNSVANSGNVVYTADYTVDTTVHDGNALTLTNTLTKTFSVSELPKITAQDIQISKDFPAPSDWKNVAAINLGASVTYADGVLRTINPSKITITANDVNIGQEGTYHITFEVDDTGTTGFPAGLAPATVTKTISVTISNIVGNAPVIHGTTDHQIIVNDTTFNLMAGISVTDVEDGVIPTTSVTATVVQESGTGYSGVVSDIPNNVGRYKVTYEVQDSHGNITKNIQYVRVYGDITVNSQPTVEARQDASKGTTHDFSTVTATYKDADTTLDVTVTGASNPALFSSSSAIDYGTIGNYAVTTAVKHPVFPSNAALEKTTTYNVHVNGPIEILNTAAIESVSPRRVNDTVDVTTGVVARYTKYDNTTVDLTSSDLRISVAGGAEAGVPVVTSFPNPGLYTVVYSVADTLVPTNGKTIVSITLPIHTLPSIQVANPTVFLEQNTSQADAEAALGVTGTIIYAESAPTVTGIPLYYDFSAVDLTEPGVYYGTVYAEDRFGVKTAIQNFEVQIYGSIVITPVLPPGGGGSGGGSGTGSGGSTGTGSGGSTGTGSGGSTGTGSGGSSSPSEGNSYVPPQPPFLNVNGNDLNIVAYVNEVSKEQVEGMVSFDASYVGPDKQVHKLPANYNWNTAVLTEGGTEHVTVSVTNPYTGKTVHSPNTLTTFILRRPYIRKSLDTLYIFEGGFVSDDGQEFGPRAVMEQPNFQTGQIDQLSFPYEFNKSAVDVQTKGIYKAFFTATFVDFAGTEFYFREPVSIIVQKIPEGNVDEKQAEASDFWVKATDILHLAKKGEVWLVTPENWKDGGEKLDETIPEGANYDRKIIVKAGKYLTMNPCFIERLRNDDNTLAEVQLEGRKWIFHSQNFKTRPEGFEFRGSFLMDMDIVHKDYLDQKARDRANMQLSFKQNRSWMGNPTFQVKLNDSLLEAASKGSAIYMYWNNSTTGELELIGKMTDAGSGYYQVPMKSVDGEYLIMAGIPTKSNTNDGTTPGTGGNVNFKITNQTNPLTKEEATELGVELIPYGTTIREISRNPEAIMSLDVEADQKNSSIGIVLGAAGGILLLGTGGFILWKKKKEED